MEVTVGDGTSLGLPARQTPVSVRTADGTPKTLAEFNPSGVASAVAGTGERLEAAVALLAGLEGEERAKTVTRLSMELVLANLGQYRSGTR